MDAQTCELGGWRRVSLRYDVATHDPPRSPILNNSRIAGRIFMKSGMDVMPFDNIPNMYILIS
jgi:hypothetical protein